MSWHYILSMLLVTISIQRSRNVKVIKSTFPFSKGSLSQTRIRYASIYKENPSRLVRSEHSQTFIDFEAHIYSTPFIDKISWPSFRLSMRQKKEEKKSEALFSQGRNEKRSLSWGFYHNDAELYKGLEKHVIIERKVLKKTSEGSEIKRYATHREVERANMISRDPTASPRPAESETNNPWNMDLAFTRA